MNTQAIDSALYQRMIMQGAANLKRYAEEINNLNVFPIPDGDTGDNMLLTISGGTNTDIGETIGRTARNVADGMLLSARGNSGVILSQLFDGIADCLLQYDEPEADMEHMADALLEGVAHAYGAVLTPTEGTILTVAREASEYAHDQNSTNAEGLLSDFLYEANNSLTRTPELLPVLKKAGVVDSGGAGLIKIVEGMMQALTGEEIITPAAGRTEAKKGPDISTFTEDSVLEFGYCTEVLVRLQNAKTDIAAFDTSVVTDYLQTIGNSVVCFKNGSVLKIHVHTMTPDKVLAFCQQYGEFLTVKIENMSLQHNSLEQEETAETKERVKYAVVTVASGDGIQNMFKELGADYVINGGQSMNPSAADFIAAFKEVNADNIYVLPNNGNIILTAKQAAELYKDSKIYVIPSRTLGEGHAALTMLDLESDDADSIASDMESSMENVITAAVSTCSRDTSANGFDLYNGEYIGFSNDTILSADNDRVDTAKRLVDSIDFSSHEICILISGKDADEKETEEIRNYISEKHPMCEIYDVDGGQSIYHYVLIVE